MTKLLSASRLNQFLGCAHQAALWLSDVAPPEENNAGLELVRKKGFEHEAVTLSALEAKYCKAVEIPADVAMDIRVQQTLIAIKDGSPLIYQGALTNDRWIGFPDFLIRTGRSQSGEWLYEQHDAKLARRAKPEYVLQLGIYAILLEELTGIPIGSGAILGGSGVPEPFDLSQIQHITRRLMRRFEEFADQADRQTRPLRVSACAQCPYAPRCEAEWRAADSLIFVANMRTSQMLKVEQAGVMTLKQFATTDPSRPIGGIGKESFSKLVNQARLQYQAQEQGRHLVETLPLDPGRGFTILPEPQSGDLFFDMEGDPLYPDGLEYLFGIWGPVGPKGEDGFKSFWAHDHAAEKLAFQDLMDFFGAHLAQYPSAHIYHYAQYEVVALKRLAQRYATREAELDNLLRAQKFVDLYRIVRHSIRASTEGYSLKDLETIYWGKRSGDVANAGDSIVAYETWREIAEQSILDEIEDYNRQDCISTEKLRNWLEGLRPPNGLFGLASANPEPTPDQLDRIRAREALEAHRQSLAAAVRQQSQFDPKTLDLIAELLWFHNRSQKPEFWAMFDRQTWTDEELIDDLESLGGLTLDDEHPETIVKNSFEATYRFEPQETKLSEGSTCKIALTLEPAGTIAKLDMENGRVVLKRKKTAGHFPASCSLIPGNIISQNVLISAVEAFARRFSSGNFSDDQALVDLLDRRYPRIKGIAKGQPILTDGQDLVSGTVDAVARLDNSYLVIQGPPGTGKTYTTSHAILALLKAGKRVAVSSNSHKAINNLLSAIQARASEVVFVFEGAKKASSTNSDSGFDSDNIESVFYSDDITPDYHLVGGTAYHFATEGESCAYDYLFVDEAGQVALGHLVAMASCTRNIVLIGDQMQLPQPVQGVHPGYSGFSCLDYLMEGHATVPPDRGILLNVSWRMHPDVCRFISDAFYDSRLVPEQHNVERYLVLDKTAHPILKPSGLAVADIEHTGCTQSSIEEAKFISDLIQSLLTQSFRDKKGVVHPISLADILVVAPFNLQVNLLRRHLPEGARVGTVDKFQGQEAPVTIVSMTTSNGADAPRGTDFLFNANRLNVALSRAQCLAILVRGRDLLEVSPGTIDDIFRLDNFARAETYQ
jgi:uncharacterized protein